MKTTLAALFATALFASPALAEGCGGYKSAKMKHEVTASVKVEEKTVTAMSTFDPDKKPAFDTEAEAATEAPLEELEAE
ncbi:hypothetical protein [Ahrensia sp. R2A130]|uniref:hypothetical protein n=1 Tax=Ahrensia sp. R2A130 TaxID=744979 RepID=UPI0001E08429|nr:hypothetical protein [Ahrensia sp. R2A130]EFL88068.1 hypothetical protein R2A130_1886 [Ahrensia sp. R2A130]